MIVTDKNGAVIDTANPLPMSLTSTTILQPVEIQGHLAQTIQAFNAVSIPLSTWTTQTGNWIDCNNFDQIAVTMLNDATTNTTVNLLWSNDGTNSQGEETLMAASTTIRRAGRTGIKARYAKVSINNGDSTLAHTISAWVYLLA